MSVKERRRLAVLEQVREGKLSVAGAGRALGISERQARRVWKRFCEQGDAGLVHRLRGREGNRRVDAALRDRVVELYREHYQDLGATLACEYLAARHGVEVDDQTLRRWLTAAGLWRRRRKSKPKRRRRPRRACFGELVQLDGSPHDWFESRPRTCPATGETISGSCCLMVMVDDATGWTWARFFESETTQAVMEVFQGWSLRHGLPQSLYPDRHSIHRRNDKEADEVELRTGKRPPTQFGRALEELGVELIWAGSPQAKGRVERKNGVLQDRLVKALRLAVGGAISELEAANRYLEQVFLPGFNERFCVEASVEADLHTPVEAERLDAALVVRDVRVVGKDQCIGHEGRVLQLEPQARMPSLAGKRVQVERDLAGEIRVKWRGQVVEHRELKERPKREKAKRERSLKEPYKPPASHPWRRAAV